MLVLIRRKKTGAPTDLEDILFSSLQLTLNTKLNFNSRPHPEKILFNTSKFSFCSTQLLLFEVAAFHTHSPDLRVTDVLYTSLCFHDVIIF